MKYQVIVTVTYQQTIEVETSTPEEASATAGDIFDPNDADVLDIDHEIMEAE